MSFEITKEIEFDAGHRVPLHTSKCQNPHGHRYRVVAHLDGEIITSGPESGMVRDFGNVKAALTSEIHDIFDHGFIVSVMDEEMFKALKVFYDPEIQTYRSAFNWKVIVVPFYPTAEMLAQHFMRLLIPLLPNIKRVDVWETPTSCAVYERE